MDALRSLLIEDATAFEHFGTRIFPVISPTSANRPYVIYRRTSIQREQSLSGPIGHPRAIVEVSVFGDTYEQSLGSADMVRRVLDGRSAAVGEVFLQSIWLEDESDDFVQLAGSEMPPLYSVTLTFGIIWKEI